MGKKSNCYRAIETPYSRQMETLKGTSGLGDEKQLLRWRHKHLQSKNLRNYERESKESICGTWEHRWIC